MNNPERMTGLDASTLEQAAADARAELSSDAPIAPNPLEDVLKSSNTQQATIDDEDIPDSDFWDGTSGGEEGVAGNTLNDDPVDEQDFDSKLEEAVFKYRAGNKDYELDLNDREALAKKLSMAEGGAKAFSDKARLSRELKAKDAEIAQLRERDELLQKLDKLRGNDRAVVEEYLGKSYEDFEKEAARKYRIREEGTDEERSSLLQQEEISQLRREMDQDKRLRELNDQRSAAELQNAKKIRLKTMTESAFFDRELPTTGDQKMDDKLKQSYWKMSMIDIAEADERGQTIDKKFVDEMFAKKYRTLVHTHENAVETKLKERVTKKKAVDKRQAQLASTENYSTPKGNPEIGNHNPLSFFKEFTKKRK